MGCLEAIAISYAWVEGVTHALSGRFHRISLDIEFRVQSGVRRETSKPDVRPETRSEYGNPMADRTTSSITIGADRSTIMTVIADFASYPEWAGQVKSA